MNQQYPLILTTLLLTSCGLFRVGSGTKFNKSEVTKVEFCDLSKHDGELIKTKLEYSGVEEYWGASGFRNCDLNHQVELDFDEFYESWRYILIEPQLQRIHNNYWDKKAKMTVVGRFEVDSVDGFGHLRTNKARIIVKNIKINVKPK